MTPAARVQTAIELLDRIATGEPAERVLTGWARRARFAGSKDRAAIRDHVFDILRRWRSTAARGGGESGRARMIGLLRGNGADLERLFSGGGYGPAPLGPEDAPGREPDGFEAWDLPDWLGAAFEESLGKSAEEVALSLRDRAEVFLRVNTLKSDLETARTRLSDDGIVCVPHDLSPTALRVVQGARAVVRSRAFTEGLVELQDAASQAVVDLLPIEPGMSVLDYCAGGGGKTLAMAARLGGTTVDAHDVDPRRMADLPERARRAGAVTRTVSPAEGPYDLVLADAPCSGSGSWRRSPEGKWVLTHQRLQDLCRIQAEILQEIAPLVAPDGVLAYATCSVLNQENAAQIEEFLRKNKGWRQVTQRQFLPYSGGDGFFISCLRRN